MQLLYGLKRRFTKFAITVICAAIKPFSYVQRLRRGEEMTFCRTPSSLQVMSWILLVIFIPFETISTIPIVTPYLTGSIVVGLVFVYIQVVFLTFFDIAPDDLKERRRQGLKPANYDPIRHQHVIENGFCNICQIHVKEQTKHCRRCNICVEKFDHHCIWLNNCVGKKNYKYFLFLVGSISVLSAFATLVSIGAILLWFTKSPFLHINQSNEMIKINCTIFAETFFPEIHPWVWICMTAVCLFINLTTAILVIHLLKFHMTLLKDGLTTYTHIMRSRTRRPISNDTITNTDSRADRDPPPTIVNPVRSSMKEQRPRSIGDSTPRNPQQWLSDDVETGVILDPSRTSHRLPKLAGISPMFRNSVDQDHPGAVAQPYQEEVSYA